jgi:alpha-1,2-mannosyltransferase
VAVPFIGGVSVHDVKAGWARVWEFLGNIPPTRALLIALGIWVIYGLTISTIVAIQPTQRSATLEYQHATDNWWSGQKSLYRKKNGYLYLPQFAMFYTPFELLPDRVGEPLWRLTCLAALAFSLWLAASHLAPEKRAVVFLVATLLVLPSSFASARNGQVNMPLGAVFIFIAIALARERWWTSAALLALTLVFKPIALAPVLLCAALYPRLRLPMIASIVVLAALPFLHFNPQYVAGEYKAFVVNLGQAGKPQGNSWCDFAGMFRTFGLELPAIVQLAARALAGLIALVLGWYALRSMDKLRGAMTVMFLTVIYLMLFNPRTETNSYIMLGAFVAVFGAYSGLVSKYLYEAAAMVGLAIILGTENYGNPIFPWTNLWLKAFATCILAGWLAKRLLGGERSARSVLGLPAH